MGKIGFNTIINDNKTWTYLGDIHFPKYSEAIKKEKKKYIHKFSLFIKNN